MRLIDADKLKKQIHCEYSDDLGILEKIDEQPTAYDVEKVVEQLEVLRDKAVKHPVTDTSIYATGMMGKAIQIVKAGKING
nr:MAG TPA: hypothetical protein [Caudoviricetes sp.]